MTSIGCTGSRASWRSSIELCKRLRLTNVASVSGDIDLTRSGRAVPGSYPRGGGEEGERRQEPPHPAQARGDRRRAASVSGGGSRPYGYEADKVTRAACGGGGRRGVRAAVAWRASRCARSSADLNERGVRDGERRRVVAAELAPDAGLAADQRPARAPRRDRRRRPSGRGSSAPRTERGSARCLRTRSGARTRPPAATCSAACSSAATAASGWSRGRGRAASAATPARRARASPAAARPTSTPTRSSSSSPRPSCTGSTRRELAARARAAPAKRARTRSAGRTKPKQRRSSSRSSPPLYGQRRDHARRVDGRPRSRSSSA